MADAQRPPGPIDLLLRASRAVLNAIGELVRDAELIEALNAELGIDHAPDTAAAAAEIAAINGELDVQAARLGTNTGLDDEIFELLIGGKRFFTLIKLLIGDGGDDEQRFKDQAWAMVTMIAGEKLRHEAPRTYTALRIAMIGYEHIEAVPRLDPLAIYNRLTGRAKRVPNPGYGPLGWAGMIGIAIGVTIVDQFVVEKKLSNVKSDRKREPGTLYLAGESDFRIGWEPDPNGDAELQAMMARAITWKLGGAVKVQGGESEIGIAGILSMLVLDAEDGGPGLLFRLSASGGGKLELVAPKRPDLKLVLEADVSGIAALEWMRLQTPDDWDDERDGGFDNWRLLGFADSRQHGTVSYTLKGSVDAPAFRIGDADKSRFDMASLSVGLAIDGDSAAGFLDIGDALLVLRLEDLGGGVGSFFKNVGAGTLEAKVDGRLRTNGKGGVTFAGEAGLRTRLLPGLGNQHVRIDYVDVELGHAEEGGVKLGFASAGRFALGPFAASLEQFGFDYVFSGERRGALVPVPPRGIGIRIGAGFIKGGGFLLLDFERGEFAGAFEVTLFGFSLKIIVLLTTKVPNGAAPYALLAMVSARWPGGGAPLPLGFKLKAVGGMIGINHRFDYQTLVDALPNGALDDILFPDDPVGDAPRILSSLRAICPIAAGARTLALMAEIGWGANYICTLRLGVVMPLDDMSRIYLIAQVKLVCFKDMPAALRLQLTCDALGEIGFNPFSLRIDARLRDSRFGAIGIQGQLVFLLKTGAESRLLIAAGGFHPNFKDVPAGLPRKIDRLAVVYEVGKLQAWVKGYFAVAAGTIQFGFDLGCRYKAGSLAFTGNFGIDALVHLKPFAFEAGFHFNAAIEYRGHELFGVHVNGTLWGPDRWRIKGRGEFSILFWDIGFDFDESWGDDVGVGDARIPLAALVDADLDDPTNWQFEVPAEARSLINFGGEETSGEALAHPLAVLTYRQRRIPFGLQLDHVGSAEIEGRSLFPVPEMTDAAGNKLPGGPVTDPFAVGEYVELDDEARLSRPSFEQLPSGVSAGAAGYRIDAARVVSVDVDYEQLFLPQKSRFNFEPFTELTADFFAHILTREAAGRSPLRGRDRVARRRDPVRTVGPDWAAVDRATRAAAAPAAEEWANRASSAVASSAGKPGGMLVVEAFELAA